MRSAIAGSWVLLPKRRSYIHDLVRWIGLSSHSPVVDRYLCSMGLATPWGTVRDVDSRLGPVGMTDQPPRPTAPRLVIVMPAYNAARTLERTYADIPHDII